jgi:hypothetical protein
MKVSSCPWCKGEGKRLIPDFDHEHANEIGSIIRFKSEKCDKCDGSGVIVYQPVKEEDIKTP